LTVNGTEVTWPAELLGYDVESLIFEFQYGQEMFFSPETIETGCGAHPASYLMGAGVLSGDKRLGRDVDHWHHLAPRLTMRGTTFLCSV